MSISCDPFLDADRRDAEQERALERLPRCTRCRYRIEDEDAVCIDGDWYCDECLKELRRSIGDD